MPPLKVDWLLSLGEETSLPPSYDSSPQVNQPVSLYILLGPSNLVFAYKTLKWVRKVIHTIL